MFLLGKSKVLSTVTKTDHPQKESTAIKIHHHYPFSMLPLLRQRICQTKSCSRQSNLNISGKESLIAPTREEIGNKVELQNQTNSKMQHNSVLPWRPESESHQPTPASGADRTMLIVNDDVGYETL